VLAALVILPFFAAALAFFIYNPKIRRALLPLTSIIEFAAALLCRKQGSTALWNILALDDLGFLVLTLTCLLFFVISLYAVDYLAYEGEYGVHKRNRLHFTNVPEAVFTACMLLFLGSAVLVTLACHLGLLWVAIEGTTIACAPLIYFHRTPQSLEATWKYIIICSVGIAFALLGNFLLDVAWQTKDTPPIPMTLSDMLRTASGVNAPWFKAAYIFIFIGYGVKMGLAPMHTWLPDAHSEAPSPVSALLSGALLNCAFLGVLRLHQLSLAAGFGSFSQELFVLFGLLSMLTATLFIVGQADFKRMLAYSSVEHMGILLLGVGIGGLAAHGGMLQLVCHSLTKGALFLLAGNILRVYHVKIISQISGLGKVLPWSGALWLAGFLAVAGSPPFGIFASEFMILRAMLQKGFGLVPLLYLLCLGAIFVGMGLACLRMFLGTIPADLPAPNVGTEKERLLFVLPPFILLLLCAALSLYQPEWLKDILSAAALHLIT
jgi:hydrogenase-4 component F